MKLRIMYCLLRQTDLQRMKYLFGNYNLRIISTYVYTMNHPGFIACGFWSTRLTNLNWFVTICTCIQVCMTTAAHMCLQCLHMFNSKDVRDLRGIIQEFKANPSILTYLT